MFLSHASQRLVDLPGGQITMSLARTRSELEDAFSLVYQSYVRAGLFTPNPAELRLTEHHFLPTTDVILAKNSGAPIATASIILDRELGLPIEAIYSDELEELRARGYRLAEVGSLADRRESPARFIQLFRHLSVLIAQSARRHECNGLVAATHPRHARFYTRQLGFEPIGSIRACPYAKGSPAVFLLLDFEDHKKRDTDIYRHLFGNPFPDHELASFEWDSETRDYFWEIYRKIKNQEADSSEKPLLAPGTGESPVDNSQSVVG